MGLEQHFSGPVGTALLLQETVKHTVNTTANIIVPININKILKI